MKENNGKGRRKKLMGKLIMIISSFAILIGFLTILGFGRSKDRLLRNVAANTVQKKDPTRKQAWREEMHDQFLDKDEAQVLEMILSAEIHLVDLHVEQEEVMRSPPNSYAGVYGSFCQLDFSIHKKDPSSVPMFRDLVEHSHLCQKQQWKFELSKIAELARHRDAQIKREQKQVPKALDLTAVVFHESRCGSTLVANTLIGMNPTKHRTYSESAPPAVAIKSVCGETYSVCSKQQAAKVLKDVMYLMSRTNDPKEERVFFKMQSVTTRNLAVFQEAFPDTPWLFVYREPVQVMMSHMKDGIRHANCVRSQVSPPKIVRDIFARKKLRVENKQPELYCAAHLASITESAVAGLKVSNRGIPVNYDTLPDRLYTEILPSIGVEVGPDDIERIQQVASKYAKGRGSRAGQFEGDSEQKEKMASEEVKYAAEIFLKESFETLSNY